MEKTILITGAASGIGKGIAEKFLGEKWKVCLLDSSAKNIASTIKDFEQKGFENFVFTLCDVSRENDVSDAIDLCVKNFGGIDAIVNNAGIGIQKSVEELSLSEWHKVVDTNLTSIFLTAKYGAKYLKKSKGNIINIASTRALMSEANTEAYSATKGGVVALSHALAMSLAPVRVNCISPGWINCTGEVFSAADHAQHPVGRIGVPADIAELAYFLASENAGFISGQNFCSDGGMTKKMIYV